MVRVDGKVSSVPSIAPVEPNCEEEADKHSDPQVECGESGNDEGVVAGLDPADDHVEIKCRPGVDTQTIVHTDDIVEDLVVRGDPADPVESRQRDEDEAREEEIHKHCCECHSEQLHSRPAVYLLERTGDWSISALRVERLIERDRDQ